jgi:hypothetical protein
MELIFMKGVILKYRGMMPIDELDRAYEQFKKEMEQFGFVIIDDRFDVIEVDTENGTE